MRSQAKQTGEAVRVLLVKRSAEDAETVMRLLREVASQRYEVEWVSTRQAANDAIRRREHDVGLVGYKLDDGDGIDIVRDAFSAAWKAPVILLTGSESAELDLTALKAGATDCLVQSQTDSVLLSRAIRYAMAKKHNEDEIRGSKEQLVQQLLDLQDAKERIESQSRDTVQIAEELARAQEELKAAFGTAEESERRYRTLAENSPVGIWQISTDRRTLYMNPVMCQMIEVDNVEELDDDSYQTFMSPESMVTMERERAVWLSGKNASWEARIVGRRSGEARDAVISGAPLTSVNGEVLGLLTTVVDITERKKVEETIRHMARHDALTSLPNRTMFQDRLQQALVNAERTKEIVAILYLDLDHFKDINDTLGHPIGDLLLQRVSDRLLACARDSDTVARLGGDEFAIIATNLRQVDDVTILARRIIDTLGQPFDLEGQKVHTATSIGITLFPADSHDPDQLLKNADLALYRAKDSGRGRYQFYDAQMDADVQFRKEMEHDLRLGIERLEFNLLYQPQVGLSDGTVVGAEALIRWHSPERGLVMPNDFIPLAESTGLINPMSEWILLAACSQAKAWQLSGLPPIRVAVNLSAIQFRTANLASIVTRALMQSELAPKWLELEITESVMMGDIERVIPLMNNLRELGVKLSVDDFGTGFSSLTYLKQFPVEKLKIDQSFVRNIVTDADDAAIAKTIVRLGQSLGIKVIAEGVETVEQLSYLSHMDCDEAQGYYFAKPLPPEEFVRWVRDFPGLDLAKVV
ncbi:MAG: two-component system response regulator [Alphaproteobacteria bacterium]